MAFRKRESSPINGMASLQTFDSTAPGDAVSNEAKYNKRNLN